MYRTSYRGRRGHRTMSRQPALSAEVRVAVFGNSHAIRTFIHPIADDTPATIGLHRLSIKWVRPDGDTIGGLGGGSNEDWRRLELDAATHALDGVWPSFAVICAGGPALVPRLGERAQGEPVPLVEDAAEAAARVVSGLEHWLTTLELVIPGTRPIVISVLPERDLSMEALQMFRGLSHTLRGSSPGSGVRYTWTSRRSSAARRLRGATSVRRHRRPVPGRGSRGSRYRAGRLPPHHRRRGPGARHQPSGPPSRHGPPAAGECWGGDEALVTYAFVLAI